MKTMLITIIFLLCQVKVSKGVDSFSSISTIGLLFSSSEWELNLKSATEGQNFDDTKRNNSDKVMTTPSVSKGSLNRIHSFWFYAVGIVSTIFLIFGVVGNILSIVILSSPEMKCSTSIFLILLSVFDSILLISNCILSNIKFFLIYTPYLTRYTHFFMLPLSPILYALSSISHTGSIYAVVAVNVERYIAVCYPLKAASLCTVSKATKTCVGLVVFSLIYNIPRYMEMYWVWRWVPPFNQTMLLTSYSETAYTFEYITVYLVYINAAVKFIIPAITLMVLNTLMVRMIYSIRPNLQKQERKSNQKERFTAMVLSVFVVFMVSLTVAFAELVLYAASGAMELEECSEICGYVSGISQMVVILNSAINFVLFCFFGHKFRRVFAKRFMSCCRK